MAEVKFSKGSEEFVLFGEFYKLCQKHWKPEENQKYWDDLKEAVDKLCEKINALIEKNETLIMGVGM